MYNTACRAAALASQVRRGDAAYHTFTGVTAVQQRQPQCQLAITEVTDSPHNKNNTA